ncbi:hypothetical protein HMPREF0198_2276 [Cardiobacterium hominis ATCC 15826]|uniref:Uncharacterized protein n=1 Tax=Cardiobacterium hominis (strain ATCC 15826 / DSM 8339 / NCTC 10426 / 6573) TaxID=638300 RepID=C8NCP8_CARH6|nr:hypothetical protein HMPREF0198_2276 [Cardiobacterium hominis ATCC 15826]
MNEPIIIRPRIIHSLLYSFMFYCLQGTENAATDVATRGIFTKGQGGYLDKGQDCNKFFNIWRLAKRANQSAERLGKRC